MPDGVVINRFDTDYGPATKLLGLASFNRDDYDLIVVTDDDCYKNAKWAETLLNKAQVTDMSTNVVSCILSQARGNRKWNMHENNIYGYTGFAISKNLFRFVAEDMINQFGKNDCFLVDDEFFTFYFVDLGVNIASCHYSSMNEINSGWLKSTDSLFALKGDMGRGANASKCRTRYCEQTNNETICKI